MPHKKKLRKEGLWRSGFQAPVGTAAATLVRTAEVRGCWCRDEGSLKELIPLRYEKSPQIPQETLKNNDKTEENLLFLQRQEWKPSNIVETLEKARVFDD